MGLLWGCLETPGAEGERGRRGAGGRDAAGAPQTPCLGQAPAAGEAQGPPCPRISFLFQGDPPSVGLWEQFPHRASVSPALAGPWMWALTLPIFQASPGMFPAPSLAPIPALGSGPAAVGAPQVLLQPCLATDHQDFGKRRHRRIPVGPLPVSPHPEEPKGLRARPVGTDPMEYAAPVALDAVTARGAGWGPHSSCPTPNRTPASGGHSEPPRGCSGPQPGAPTLGGLAQVAPESHLVPPPRGFVFPGRSILIPATSRSHPRAQPGSPLSRAGSGIQHSLFPSVSLRPPPLPPSSLSPSLPSSSFFFFSRQEMSCLPADVTKSTLEMSATAGKGPR